MDGEWNESGGMMSQWSEVVNDDKVRECGEGGWMDDE